jgi:hypothetical protein
MPCHRSCARVRPLRGFRRVVPTACGNDVDGRAVVEKGGFVASASVVKRQPGKSEFSRPPNKTARNGVWIAWAR